MYVADFSNNWVQVLNTGGGYVANLSVSNAVSVAIDGSGNAYVVESTTSVVAKFNSSGIQISSFGNSSQLSGPEGIAVDSNGNIYVADTGRFRSCLMVQSRL